MCEVLLQYLRFNHKTHHFHYDSSYKLSSQTLVLATPLYLKYRVPSETSNDILLIHLHLSDANWEEQMI